MFEQMFVVNDRVTRGKGQYRTATAINSSLYNIIKIIGNKNSNNFKANLKKTKKNKKCKNVFFFS